MDPRSHLLGNNSKGSHPLQGYPIDKILDLDKTGLVVENLLGYNIQLVLGPGTAPKG